MAQFAAGSTTATGEGDWRIALDDLKPGAPMPFAVNCRLETRSSCSGRIAVACWQRRLTEATHTMPKAEHTCSGCSAGGPFTLRADSNGQSIFVHEVYVGSVWLLAGQSNIVLSLSDMLIGRAEALATRWRSSSWTPCFRAPLPDVRIYQVGASALAAHPCA